MMVSDEMGDLPAGSDEGLGLYFSDTRFLSTYEFHLNRMRPILLSTSMDESYVATFQMVNPVISVDGGKRTIPQQSLSIRRSRFIHGGLHERIGIQNCGREPLDIECTLVFDADFRDIFEVREVQPTNLERPRPLEMHDYGMTFSYQGLDGVQRRTEVVLHTRPTERHGGTVTYRFQLPGQEMVTLVVDVVPLLGKDVPNLDYLFEDALQSLQRSYQQWDDNTTQIRTDDAFLDRGLLRRSQMDLRILLEEFDTGLLPMAGIPWFSAPFGRDSLITSMQTLMLNPDIARGTLRYLARRQGLEVDSTREEEPGKILHEERFGELANLKQIPHTPYFGSVDTTPLFLVCVVELMNWLDDRDLFVELLPAIVYALAWLNTYGDRDGDGFVEYGNHVPGGIRNQVWKDSHDSLLFPDGQPPKVPIAPVEVQGYVYRAKAGLSRLLERMGEHEKAIKLAHEACQLRRQFEERFWMEEGEFYAQALDGDKRQVPSITSNPGHCLWAGLCTPERAKRVGDRLLAPDMFSGWGIRTLSSSSPHYNPMSYQNGAVWPHDNSIIAMGLRRYRLASAAARVATAIMDTGIRMPQSRLPELFCGFERDDLFNAAPAQYLLSCNPQAWGAGAVYMLLQTVLGIFPDAVAGRAYLSPIPFAGVRSVEVRGMRLGTGKLSFRVSYPGDRPHVDVLEQPGNLTIIHEDPPPIS